MAIDTGDSGVTVAGSGVMASPTVTWSDGPPARRMSVTVMRPSSRPAPTTGSPWWR